MRSGPISRGIGVTLLLGLAATDLVRAADRDKAAVMEDRVVAGSPQDFMEVRHLVLKGTNEAIGRALTAVARERFHVEPTPSSDSLRTRVQRRYIARHDPILFERMKGVAAGFGRKLDDDSLNFSALWYAAPSAGCSVMYFPPGVTETGAGVLSRDYDFTTGTFQGTTPAKGELPCTARPYLIEMYPDQGYPSLALCAYDLLGGVLDGINSEGLTVSLMADDELHSKYPMEATVEPAVGLGVLQMQRHLLDHCADV